MIPGLPSVGGLELIIILLIVLLFFGASRLPQMGRSIGHGIKEFRKGISGSAQEDEVRDRKEEDHPSVNGTARSEELSYAEKENEKENERETVRSTEQKKP